MAVFSVAAFTWFFWGYSLTFSVGGSKFIGNLDNFGLMNVLDAPSVGGTKIPALTYCLYQMMFATITVSARSLDISGQSLMSSPSSQ